VHGPDSAVGRDALALPKAKEVRPMDEEELIIDDDSCNCPSCAAMASTAADCDCEGLTCVNCGSCVKHCKCPGGPAMK
jgi:hypothetical protein